MKKSLSIIILFCLSLLAACSNYSYEDDLTYETTETYTSEDSQTGSEDSSFYLNQESDVEQEIALSEKNISNSAVQAERKIIYSAHLHVEVKNYQESYNQIQEQVSKLQGYIVDSTMYENPENELKEGQITVRIPVEQFTEFTKFVEDGSNKVLESSTSGQDVTEEYIDLDSRLNSKKVVEKRLLSFMEEAEKTEDLLKISNDLAKVQEEIEELTGRMNYLENRSDLATVSIFIQEVNVTLSSTGKDSLNTWEQTKEQFMKSVNYVINAFSSLFIFLIGNLPVISLIGIVGIVVFLLIRKSLSKKITSEDEE